ncbi:terpenoid synthase [Daldinia caldariorum]|uniref:terpenoid synthase n=1 Tax=Daldinia caldariorum TaxID=326644 RepID=UPI0020073B95|nr:terpenoid synthase [Daldinia caldariorum]KAI1472128.1 terpenoid synthase [Daldinia caldariorum]
MSYIERKCDALGNQIDDRSLQSLISSFLENVGYTKAPDISNELYWAALHRRATSTGIPHPKGSHAYKCLIVGGNYGIACLSRHPLDIQVYVGIYTWIAIVVDDVASRSSDDFVAFHERFSSGTPQPTILLECWAALIRSCYDYWDPLVVNFIVASSLDFHNACVLEASSEMRHLVRTEGGQSFPWYVRRKTGLSDAYAYFTFPKAMYPDVSCFLEAIPDLSAYFCLANDVLSFYKEEKAGDRYNYIHYRASYDGKDTRTVLREIIQQMQDAVRRMRVVVDGRQPYEQGLNDHILGYIGYHILSDRYKLAEIGLVADDACATANGAY